VKSIVRNTLINPTVLRQHHKAAAAAIAKYSWIQDEATNATLDHCCGYALAKLHKKMNKNENEALRHIVKIMYSNTGNSTSSLVHAKPVVVEFLTRALVSVRVGCCTPEFFKQHKSQAMNFATEAVNADINLINAWKPVKEMWKEVDLEVDDENIIYKTLLQIWTSLLIMDYVKKLKLEPKAGAFALRIHVLTTAEDELSLEE